MGGWMFPANDWRYAFIATAMLTLLTTLVAVIGLPKPGRTGHHSAISISYRQLLGQWPLVRYFICAAGSFAVFSSVFNYLPFRLADAPFGWSTEAITTLYLVYIMGIFMAPLAGRLSLRFGSRVTLVAGSLVLLLALLILQLASLIAVIVGLTAVCAGFFCVHAAAVGALNRCVNSGHGRANALYVLFYYVGGWLGISLNGLLYQHWGWSGVIALSLVLVLIPLGVGLTERR
jgi:YNFM family putative membrane transporter